MINTTFLLILWLSKFHRFYLKFTHYTVIKIIPPWNFQIKGFSLFVYKDVQFPKFVFLQPNLFLSLTDSYRCQNTELHLDNRFREFSLTMQSPRINLNFQDFGQSLQTRYWILDSDGVFCVSDGWSTTESAYTYSSANVYVQAWKFSISDILFTQTDTRGSGISLSSTITLPQPFNIDNHIFLVQVCSD